MQQLEEVRRGRGAKEGRACWATEGSGKQGKCKRVSKHPIWSGSQTCLGLHACLQSSHLSSTAKPSYELLAIEIVFYITKAQREPLSRLTPLHVWQHT